MKSEVKGDVQEKLSLRGKMNPDLIESWLILTREWNGSKWIPRRTYGATRYQLMKMPREKWLQKTNPARRVTLRRPKGKPPRRSISKTTKKE